MKAPVLKSSTGSTPASALRVALVNPNTFEYDWAFPKCEHLGIAYLAALLRRAGQEVLILDADALGLGDEAVLLEVEHFRPDVIGVTFYSNTGWRAEAMIRRLRRAHPTAHITVGGQHASALGERLLNYLPELDSVVRGEGETTLLNLVARLSRGEALHGLPGLSFRASDCVYRNDDPPQIDELDDLPFPPRDTFERAQRMGLELTLGVISSRGCPRRCSFCSLPGLYRSSGKKRWRSRTPENVVAEIAGLRQRFGLDAAAITFHDDNFFGGGGKGAAHARAVARGITTLPQPMRFSMAARVDNIHERETLEYLRTCGLRGVLIGIESGSDEVLRIYQKGVTVKQIEDVMRTVRELGLRATYPIILFNPYLTPDTLAESIEFLYKHRHLTRSMTSCFQAYPGCELRDRLEQDGMLIKSPNPFVLDTYRWREEFVQRVAELVHGLPSDSVYHDARVIVRCVSWVLPSTEGRLRTGGFTRQADDVALWGQRLAHYVDLIENASYRFFQESIRCARRPNLEKQTPAIHGRYLERLAKILKEGERMDGLRAILDLMRAADQWRDRIAELRGLLADVLRKGDDRYTLGRVLAIGQEQTAGAGLT